MKKILYVILNGQQYGGSEKHVVDLVNHFSKHNDVSLIMSKGNKMCDYIDKEKCKKIYILDRNEPLCIFKIRNIIKHEMPEIVHAHAARGIVYTRFAIKSMVKKGKLKLLCTAHGWILSYLKFSKIKEKLLLLNRNVDSLTLAVSKHSMDEMIEKGYDKDKISFIYNGIDIKSFNSVAKLKNSVENVNYIGRFTEQKGIIYLMNAIEKFKNSSIKFNIYGAGEKEKYIKNYIKDKKLKNVSLHGFIGADKIKNVLKDTDILLMPSLDEGLPYMLIEAIASGVPCIATNVGGVPEVIDDSVGRLIEKQNVDKIVNAIKEINSCDIKTLSKNCIEKSKKFDCSVMYHNLEEIYDTLRSEVGNE